MFIPITIDRMGPEALLPPVRSRCLIIGRLGYIFVYRGAGGVGAQEFDDLGMGIKNDYSCSSFSPFFPTRTCCNGYSYKLDFNKYHKSSVLVCSVHKL